MVLLLSPTREYVQTLLDNLHKPYTSAGFFYFYDETFLLICVIGTIGNIHSRWIYPLKSHIAHHPWIRTYNFAIFPVFLHHHHLANAGRPSPPRSPDLLLHLLESYHVSFFSCIISFLAQDSKLSLIGGRIRYECFFFSVDIRFAFLLPMWKRMNEFFAIFCSCIQFHPPNFRLVCFCVLFLVTVSLSSGFQLSVSVHRSLDCVQTFSVSDLYEYSIAIFRSCYYHIPCTH